MLNAENMVVMHPISVVLKNFGRHTQSQAFLKIPRRMLTFQIFENLRTFNFYLKIMTGLDLSH